MKPEGISGSDSFPKRTHRPSRPRGGGGPASPGLPRVGVLALQGDFAAHALVLARLGADPVEVRTSRELDGLTGIIIPGGESTTLLRLMRWQKLDQAILDFHAGGGALFGTCAGAILLARRVSRPEQESLRLIDVTVERNGFGRQIDSFVAPGRLQLNGRPGSLEMVFIRAPRIREVGPAARALGWLGEEPVLVREGRVLVATFHPELSGDPSVHRYFLERLVSPPGARGPGPEAAV